MTSVKESMSFTDDTIAVLHCIGQEQKDMAGPLLDTQQAIKQIVHNREKAIQEAIKGFVQQSEEVEYALHQIQAQSRAAKEWEEIQTELSQAESHRDAIKIEVTQLRAERDSCMEESQRLNLKHQELEHKTTKALPSCRYDVDIYHHISGIRWQYDCPPEEVKGYVHNKNSMKTFSLNSNNNSKFFIANYLWDLMEPDW